MTLARLGYHVGLLARSEKPLRDVAAECEKLGVRTAVFVCDVTDTEALEKAVHECARVLGGLNVLVHNAAVLQAMYSMRASRAQYDAHIDINVRAAMQASRVALPYLLPEDRAQAGTIIFISSIAGLGYGQPGLSPYVMSKYALRGYAFDSCCCLVYFVAFC